MKIRKYVSYLIYVTIFIFFQNESIALPAETDSLPIGSFLGVCSHLTREKQYDNTFKIHQELMNITKSANMNFIRTGFKWKDIHPSPNKWNWRITDEVVASAKERGIRILALVGGGPQWAIPPEKYINDWTTFVDSLVTRYGNYISHWEIWNEPNLPSGKYWPQNNFPEEYADYVCNAYNIIKQKHPESTVLLGGFATGKKSEPFRKWDELFQIGILECVDGVAFHPYHYSGLDILIFNKKMRELIARYSSQDKELWATEYGIPSIQSSSIKKYDYETQVNKILQTVLLFWYDSGQRMFIFNLKDKMDYKPSMSKKELHSNRSKFHGIIKSDLKPKPAYKAVNWVSNIISQHEYLKAEILENGAIVKLKDRINGEIKYITWSFIAAEKILESAENFNLKTVESYEKQLTVTSISNPRKIFSNDTVFFWH